LLAAGVALGAAFAAGGLLAGGGATGGGADATSIVTSVRSGGLVFDAGFVEFSLDVGPPQATARSSETHPNGCARTRFRALMEHDDTPLR
jgi:hypothetical protein